MRYKHILKNIALSLLIALAFTGAYCLHLLNVQRDIAASLLRFHVLANSDGKQDQQLKLQVRNDVIGYVRDVTKGANSAEDTKLMLSSRLEEIRGIAQDTVNREGYAYDVSVSLTNSTFPTCYYAGFTLPAGGYDALRIEIGEAKGQNWFCVLFPPLCFDGGDNAAPDSNARQLQRVLPGEKYSVVAGDRDSAPAKIKLRIIELFTRGKS